MPPHPFRRLPFFLLAWWLFAPNAAAEATPSCPTLPPSNPSPTIAELVTEIDKGAASALPLLENRLNDEGNRLSRDADSRDLAVLARAGQDLSALDSALSRASAKGAADFV